MAGGETDVNYTPTWAVAAVCGIIVIISLAFERSLHYLGKFLKRKKQNSLYEALLKIKEELMLLGFISLLLTVFQSVVDYICIPEQLANKWLPCEKIKDDKNTKTTAHFESFFSSSISTPHGIGRRLLAPASSSQACTDKEGQVPLLSNTTLHHLHIFIFILAVAHVTTCALTIFFGEAKIRQWKPFEESAPKVEEEASKTTLTPVRKHPFIKDHFRGIGKIYDLLGWLHSFFKQFYRSINESDYIALRRGFIMNHCKGNPKFNFYKYMMRTLKADFKKVVGISWYLWLFVIVFLLLNVHGWHAYFWIAFIPLIVLLAIGTKLEHIMTQLAQEIAENHDAIEGDLVVKPSDDHFWFHKPRLVLLLIKIILFQNSLEIAVLFWIWFQFHFHSCIMGPVDYIVPRIIIRVFAQFLCSYSTLPLYAIVTQMGSSFNKAIFDDAIQEWLVSWAKKAKRLRKLANIDINQVDNKEDSAMTLELEKVGENKEPEMDPSQSNIAGEIMPERDFNGLK